MLETKKNEIVMIPVEKIYSHRDNPRKELGDLSELTESIKAQGILQNLTVVPWSAAYFPEPEPVEGAVVTVIGHRRTAAAKAAGLTELPCVVTDMDHKTQVSVMLLENLQRADLTIYEQAQGFQMMMNMGATVKEISDTTGFAERTVQRRLQIAKLPEEIFDREAERQPTLEEYVEISRIKDPKVQKRLASLAGSGSFKWNMENALREQEAADAMPHVRALLEEAGLKEYKGKENPVYSVAWRQVGQCRIVDVTEIPVKWKADGECWYEYGERIIILAKETKQAAAKEKYEKKEKIARELRRKANEINKRMYESRLEFIKSFKNEKKYEKEIRRALLEGIALQVSKGCPNVSRENTWLIIDKISTDRWSRPEYKDLMPVLEKGEKLALLAWIMTGDQKDYKPYYEGVGEGKPTARKKDNYEMEAILRGYAFLERIGYRISDEERQMLDGTHPVYKGKIK